MRWETTRRYTARPYLAFWVGVVALITGLGWALASGHWEDWQWGLSALGVALLVYGAVILQQRGEYRRNSKWTRTHGPD